MNTPQSPKGKRPRRFIQADVGNGFANYALVDGQWYSVNGTADCVSEVRWACSATERDQLVAIVASRFQRGVL
jgi:hypothetical protein